MGRFTDTAGHWAEDQIDWAADEDWFEGFDDGSFRPDEPFTRAQAATVAWRKFREPEPPPPAPDTVPPVVTLLGEPEITIIQHSPWVDPGATAWDNVDGELPVATEGTVDTSTPGEYTIRYTAVDAAGNRHVITRTVKVQKLEVPPQTDFDVTIGPGDNIADLITEAGAEGRIGWRGGIYNGFSHQPLPGQLWAACPGEGPVFDGANTYTHAIEGHGIPAVTIQGPFEIRNYGRLEYHGAICSLAPGDWYNHPIRGIEGWKIAGAEIHHCSYGATLAGDNVELTDFVLRDLDDLGFKILFGADGYVARGEMYNIKAESWGHEGGGSKSWETNGLVHEDIHLQDIDGPGLWTDSNNDNTVYRRITAERVTNAAIFHEISQSALIEDCTLTGGTGGGSNGIWTRADVGIQIANAGYVTIRRNRLTGFYAGISCIDQIRDDQYGNDLTDTTGGEVHDNTIDGCRYNGDARDHTVGGPKYTLGGLPVHWHDNELLNGSLIN